MGQPERWRNHCDCNGCFVFDIIDNLHYLTDYVLSEENEKQGFTVYTKIRIWIS